jgi:hypothetical protein
MIALRTARIENMSGASNVSVLTGFVAAFPTDDCVGCGYGFGWHGARRISDEVVVVDRVVGSE